MLKIRNSISIDVDDISSVHVKCWSEHYSFLPKIIHSARSIEYRKIQWAKQFNHDGTSKGGLFSVISEQGKLVGFGFCTANSDLDIKARGELHAAYFLPEYRGGVAGGMLLLNMARYLRESDLWPACIWAWRDNRTRINYSMLGFTVVHKRCRNIAGVDIPEVGYISPPYRVLRKRIINGIKIRTWRDEQH